MTDKKKDMLALCPFCGSLPKVDGKWVVCNVEQGCPIRFKEVLLNDWNRRSPSSELERAKDRAVNLLQEALSHRGHVPLEMSKGIERLIVDALAVFSPKTRKK